VVLGVARVEPERGPGRLQGRLLAPGLVVGDPEQEVGLGVVGLAAQPGQQQLDRLVVAAQVDQLLGGVQALVGRHGRILARPARQAEIG
jgi:hypothetical protein